MSTAATTESPALARDSASVEGPTRRRAIGELTLLWLGIGVALVILQLGRKTPTNFADEFIYGRLAENLGTGDGYTIQGGPVGIRTLYPLVIAPAWALFEGVTAYRTALAINALCMSAVVFPAWALARRVASHRWALAAAACAALVPSMVWAGMLMTEAVAYPVTAAALWAAVRAIDRPGIGPAALFVLLTVAAVSVRTQLVVLLPVLAVALLLDLLRHRGELRRRAREHRFVLGLVIAGGLIGGGAFLFLRRDTLFGGQACVVGGGTPSPFELVGPFIDYAGALAVASLLLPVIATLALATRRENWAAPGLGPLLAVGVAAMAGLLAEAAWFSVTTAPELQERYVVYATPVLTACLVALPGRVGWRTVGVVSAVVATYLLVAFPGFGDVTGTTIAARLGLPQPIADLLDAGGALWAGAAAVLGALAVWGLRRSPRAALTAVCGASALFGIGVIAVRQLEANRQSADIVARWGDPQTIAALPDAPIGVVAQPRTDPVQLWHLQLWKPSVDRTYRVARPDGFGVGALCPLVVDGRTGAVRPAEPCRGRRALPPYLMLATGRFQLRLDGASATRPDERLPLLYALDGDRAPRMHGTPKRDGLKLPRERGEDETPNQVVEARCNAT